MLCARARHGRAALEPPCLAARPLTAASPPARAQIADAAVVAFKHLTGARARACSAVKRALVSAAAASKAAAAAKPARAAAAPDDGGFGLGLGALSGGDVREKGQVLVTTHPLALGFRCPRMTRGVGQRAPGTRPRGVSHLKSPLVAFTLSDSQDGVHMRTCS